MSPLLADWWSALTWPQVALVTILAVIALALWDRRR
jgi:hypothetical protein